MSVYVDKPIHPYRQMLMCHMVADTLDELHTMADWIGIKRHWFQDHNPRYPHYDICKSKRSLALQRGAIEVTTKEIVRIIRRNYHE